MAGIYKAYDIRGVYPTELNEDTAVQVARALVALTNGRRFAVGRDMRVSSPALWKALTDELVTLGCEVIDIGLIPTEAIYFAAGSYDFDVTMTVTASHNPAEYNGFKMMRGKTDAIRGTEIGSMINQLPEFKHRSTGRRSSQDVLTPYLEHVLAQVDGAAFKPLKVVIDAGNGMAGAVIPKLMPSLPVQVLPLFFELDGRFPNRASNPLADGVLDALKKKVVDEGADCGVAFDGDCDRVFFVDEQGQFVQGDMTLLLIAQELLREFPGRTVVYNAICSRAVPEIVAELGGKAVRTAVGYVNTKQGLIDHNGIVSGEVSAHYSFPVNFNGDSGFLAMLKVLELLSRSGKQLSQLVKRFQKYVRLEELNIKVADTAAALDKVRQYFAGAKMDELDGVTVWFDDWWANIRPSNTEPLLRITVEANTRELAEAKQREIVGLIKK